MGQVQHGIKQFPFAAHGSGHGESHCGLSLFIRQCLQPFFQSLHTFIHPFQQCFCLFRFPGRQPQVADLLFHFRIGFRTHGHINRHTHAFQCLEHVCPGRCGNYNKIRMEGIDGFRIIFYFFANPFYIGFAEKRNFRVARMTAVCRDTFRPCQYLQYFIRTVSNGNDPLWFFF